jgi:antitoxin (DNA-binding transcriptional repressor) of toxin-antitoxin stability system
MELAARYPWPGRGKELPMSAETTKTISIEDAPPLLAELVKLTLAGTSVIVAEAGTPLVRLVPATTIDQPRIAGLNEGEAWTSDDFDDELPVIVLW